MREQKDECKLGQPHFLTFLKASIDLVVLDKKVITLLPLHAKEPRA